MNNLRNFTMNGKDTKAEVEVILGQIIGKANNYLAVPDGAGGRRMIKNNKIRAYEKNFLRQCRVYAGRMINRPFEINAVIYYIHNNFDLDNSLKTLLDCLQYARAIADDKLCIHINATKRIDPYRPRVEFSIIPDKPQPGLFDGMI